MRPLALLIACLPVFIASPAFAENFEVNIGAQYRPRVESDHRFSDTSDFFVTHRARLSVGIAKGDWSVFIQPQDVRAWGEESGTLADEAAVDLHQGYAQYKAGDAFNLRAGRQEIAYLNHRIIGTVNWSQPARSFDAVRVGGTAGKVRWDAFAAPLSQQTGKNFEDPGVVAGLLQWRNAKRTVALLAVSDFKPSKKFYRWTVGPYSAGPIAGPLGYRVEGYWQQGHAPGREFKSYLAAAELNAAFADAPGKPGLAVAYDHVSGGSTEYATFDTLFATNHKFYGYMDAFLALPNHTGGAGLRDAYVRGSLAGKTLDLQVTVHRFLTATDALGGNRVFGTETDAVVTWKPAGGVSLQVGYAVLYAGKAFELLRPQAPSVPTWGYTMLSVEL